MKLRACGIAVPSGCVAPASAKPAPRDFDLSLVMAVAAVAAAAPAAPRPASPGPAEGASDGGPGAAVLPADAEGAQPTAIVARDAAGSGGALAPAVGTASPSSVDAAVVQAEVVLVGDSEPPCAPRPTVDSTEDVAPATEIEAAVLAAIERAAPSALAVASPPDPAPAPARTMQAPLEILPGPIAADAVHVDVAYPSAPVLSEADTLIVVVHPELGEVELSLRLSGSEMDVVAVAADRAGAQALLRSEAALRAVVGTHGVKLRSLVARVREKAGEPHPSEAARRRRFRLELVA